MHDKVFYSHMLYSYIYLCILKTTTKTKMREKGVLFYLKKIVLFWAILLSHIHPSCAQITTAWKHTELQSPSPEGWHLLVSNRRGSFSNCVGFFALRAGAHRATCRAEKLVIHRLREVEEAVKMSSIHL